MRIEVAKEIGFCFGVARAIKMARDACAEHGCVYTLGELIHNAGVVNKLDAEGIHPAQTADGIPAGAAVIIRSHGVSEAAERELRESFRVIDATCPYVKRIHGIVSERRAQGKTILIIGDPKHPECIGINGHCGDSARFLTCVADAAAVPDDGAYCLVSQTTSSAELNREIKAALRERLSDIEICDTVCDTTEKRQAEAVSMSQNCTQMIVIGDKNSSNTRKLAAICKKYCEIVQSIENTSELSLEKIRSNDIIGIVAGASAPDWIIREVITRMSELEKTMAGNPVENSEVKAEASATVDEPAAAVKSAVETAEPAEAAEASFAEAFEKTLVRIRNGQIITGSVVQIVDGEVCVNIGYKSDGFIPRSEFSSDTDVKPEEIVKIGDSIEVEVLKVNDGEGNVLLSRKNVESKKMWDNLMQDEEIQDKIFDGVGKEVVKGGLIASIDGVRTFIPASQLSTKYVENIAEFVGKPIKLKIIEVDKARKRIVASHKAVMIAEAEEQKKQKWGELVVGSTVKGVVRRLTDFGAFVDIGGIDGLVHVTDVAWGRVKHTSDVLSIGQEIEVLIRDVDVEKQRVSLGYKQLQPKPWTMAAEKYPIGSVVEGKVVRIVPFGAFVALEPTIDGLIHISQVGVRHIVKVEDEINVGDTVRCKVLDVNPEAKRISLSRREVIIEENPEVAEELAKEKAERERVAQERAEQRANSEQTRPQRAAQPQQDRPERSERTDRSNSDSRPPRRERNNERGDRPRREDSDYELPPVQQATTSLADLFSGFNTEDK